jgi:hypothetical protein
MDLHNNFADVGTWHLRTRLVSILNIRHNRRGYLGPHETKVFDLEVSTRHEGLCTICVHVVGTLAGNRHDNAIDGTKRPIVFFAQERDYPVD